MSTVTASLNGLSSADVLVTVSATAVAPAVAGDVMLSGNRELTITAGHTESTGEVRVTAVGNTVDAPNKSVEVTASVTGGNGVTAPDSRSLTITDDEELPVVTLALDPAFIGERRGVSTVTASLDRPSSQRVTVTGLGGAGLPRYDERLPARRDDADDRAVAVGEHRHGDHRGREQRCGRPGHVGRRDGDGGGRERSGSPGEADAHDPRRRSAAEVALALEPVRIDEGGVSTVNDDAEPTS